VQIAPEDALAYKFADNRAPPIRIQDPNAHYWIYLTTAKGEELILDCGLLPFNIWRMIDSDVYRLSSDESQNPAPCYFCTTEQDPSSSHKHIEHRRHSVLHDTDLAKIITTSTPDEVETMTQMLLFLERVTGGSILTQDELETRVVQDVDSIAMELDRSKYVLYALKMQLGWMDECTGNREWERFPAEPVYMPIPEKKTWLGGRYDPKLARDRSEKGRKAARGVDE
jgi:hypothetical protein